MWYPSLLQGLSPGSAGAEGIHSRAARRKPAARRLHLEPLEDRWCPSYSITDLGALGGANSYAYSINYANPVQVAGYAQLANGVYNAFLYSSGNMTGLGTLKGDTWSKATALNKSGQVAGISVNGSDPGGIIHAFIWNGTQMTDLGNLGSSNTHARAINSNGQVVGDGYTAAGVDDAWLWQGGPNPTDLNSLPGIAGSGWVLSQAWGINDQQQIVGQGTINGQQLSTCTALANGAHLLAFSPDGKQLAAGDVGGTVKIWDVSARRELRSLSTALLLDQEEPGTR
jgi:probable HAF family extracellular repeat protein